ncbi:molybdopterin converting factor, subunit 1 [Tolumonas auensis DSM 9187]|uniref:Molybdopterin synthase sulfur carrier subunit n=1 Tax=Tolumonas auensis (strain DSM 9187 / NBRC 110442 / TA 4) TaxID=595494 RepID=C4LFJ9_TOLAT|nr:molybdopterin synthase sulfur carrier subunit [Tolumonas auensis]ACQ93366.1 molybdopterin converting factor, subunit 1 [Tolumonas auensis DSM 9187]
MKVLFFAQTRELVGVDELTIDEPYLTAQQLREALATRGDKWQLALQESPLLVAVNQCLVPWDTPLSADDEIAFFPPVTGG